MLRKSLAKNYRYAILVLSLVTLVSAFGWNGIEALGTTLACASTFAIT